MPDQPTRAIPDAVEAPTRGAESARPTAGGRVEWVSVARGIGIVLVVAGHVISAIPAEQRGPALIGLAGWIYQFHMPAFFFLSGLFAPASLAKRGAARFLGEKVATIVYPYLVWGVLQVSAQVVLGRLVHNPMRWGDLSLLLYAPPMHLWFLYALFLAFVAFAASARLGVGTAGFLVLSLIYGSMPWGSPTGIPGRLAEDLPFFALGTLLHRSPAAIRRLPLPALAAIAAAGFAANTAITWYAGDRPYALRLAFALPGVAMLVGVSAPVERLGAAAGLAWVGARSMEIYLAHVFAYSAARLVLTSLLGVTDPIANLVVGTAVGVAGPALLSVAAERVGFPYLFRWPTRRPTGPDRPPDDRSARGGESGREPPRAGPAPIGG